MAIFASLAMAILLAIVPAYTLQGQLGIPKILLCIGVVAMTAHAIMSCAVSSLMKFRFVAATAVLAGIVNLTGCAWASYTRNPLIAIMTYVAAYALQVLILFNPRPTINNAATPQGIPPSVANSRKSL